MEAPGRTAPVESLTVPVRRAVSVCATSAGKLKAINANAKIVARVGANDRSDTVAISILSSITIGRKSWTNAHK
jgi:hypothetical protein